MSELQRHLDRLTSYVGLSKQPPSWSRVLIVEDTAITHGEFSFIPRSALATPEAYVTRFESHLNAGHAWINMSAAGVLDDTLLVVIELPSYTNTVPKDKVSVNLSRPNINTTNRIKIID